MLVNIKTALAARGLRQIDLALSEKIPPTVLSEVINGRREASPELRSRIACALQADEGWLFSRVTRIPRHASDEESTEPAVLNTAGTL